MAGTLVLHRACGLGTRRSAACFAGWLQRCVKPLAPCVHHEGAAEHGAVPGDSFQAPTPNSVGRAGLSAWDFPYALFRSVSMDIPAGSPSALPWEHQGQPNCSSSPKIHPPCSEELSPVCCQALQCSREGSWRAAHPGSDARENAV